MKLYESSPQNNYYLKDITNGEPRCPERNFEYEVIALYPDITYQTFDGFGGAITEASGYVFSLMPDTLKKEVVDACFSEQGNNYSLCRTHINSCDFALGNYASCDVEGDVNLDSFDLTRDDKYIIPLLSAAKEAAKDLHILVSPWSPPAWMKTTGQMNQGGKLKEEYQKAWASYYVKYVREMKKRGFKIDYITVQNEPNASQSWDSCTYTAEEERDFVAQYLGEELCDNDIKDVQLFIWDHNKDCIVDRAKTILSDENANKYVDGIAFHWYTGDHFEALRITNELFPDKKLYHTEGCLEGGVQMGSLTSGEKYAHDIFGCLNNFANGYIDWNILLDHKGGPNHVGNFCDAPIIYDETTGKVIYETSFYYIGHFSRFILPDSKRIAFSKYTQKIGFTAFIRPDNLIAFVAMNQEDVKYPICIKFCDKVFEFNLKPHSIVSGLL